MKPRIPFVSERFSRRPLSAASRALALFALVLSAGLLFGEDAARKSRLADKFQIICKEGVTCVVEYQSRKLVELDGCCATEPQLTFLDFRRYQGEIFLLEFSASDGCPSQYQIIEVGPARAFRSPVFGNCNSPAIIRHKGTIEFQFAADDEADRAAKTYQYRNRRLRSVP